MGIVSLIKGSSLEVIIRKHAERFIVLITREPFDYTKWRENNLNEDISVRELSQKAMAYSKNL